MGQCIEITHWAVYVILPWYSYQHTVLWFKNEIMPVHAWSSNKETMFNIHLINPNSSKLLLMEEKPFCMCYWRNIANPLQKNKTNVDQSVLFTKASDDWALCNFHAAWRSFTVYVSSFCITPPLTHNMIIIERLSFWILREEQRETLVVIIYYLITLSWKFSCIKHQLQISRFDPPTHHVRMIYS